MEITNDELEQVQSLAAVLMKPTEIAIILKRNVSEFMLEINAGTGEVFEHYTRGILLVKADINTRIIALAQTGSQTAIDSLILLLNEQKADEYEY